MMTGFDTNHRGSVPMCGKVTPPLFLGIKCPLPVIRPPEVVAQYLLPLKNV